MELPLQLMQMVQQLEQVTGVFKQVQTYVGLNLQMLSITKKDMHHQLVQLILTLKLQQQTELC